MKDSFVQLIIDSAESHLDKTAMQIVGEETEGKYTFCEVLNAVRSIAYRLEKEGIAFGDRVALIGENHPRWAIAYLGMLYRGVICVPIDPHAEIETLTNFLENSEAKLAFIGKDFIKHFHQVEERLGRQIPAVVLQDIESNNGFQTFQDWSTTTRPGDFDARPLPATLEDTAVLMYTSGTTGTPKGVPLTHGNIYYETKGCQEAMNLSDKEVVLSVLPLFHVFAQVVNLWVIASVGAKVWYVKELAPAELEKAFKTKEITLLTGVPRLWYLFHKKIFDGVAAQPKAVQILFNNLLKTNVFLRDNFNVNMGKKFFGKVHDGFGGKLDITISAGSRFDEKIARDYHALGFTLIQGYGLTETTGAIACTRFEDSAVGTVGKAINYAEIKLGESNEDGAGEVLIRGKQVFGGYYKNPEATKDAFTEDGWFRSGDLGKFDAAGHLSIVGRSKDVIVLPNGKNIHPEDIETHYSKTSLVGEISVLGIKDKTSNMTGAEKLVAVVVPDFEFLKKNNIANSREAIRHELDDLGRSLPEYQRVRDYIIRAEPLPRTATRKVKRFQLQKEIEQNGTGDGEANLAKQWKSTDEDTALLNSSVGRTLVKYIKQNSDNPDAIHPEMNLEIDLGLDSLSRAEVFAGLEQAFNIEFDSDEAGQTFSVGDLIKLVEKQTGSANAEIVQTDFNWGKIIREADDSAPEIQHVLRKRVVFPWLVFVVFRAIRLLSKIFLKLEVSGAEQLDKLRRPYLVCPNHQSFIDPIIVTSNYSAETVRHTFAVGATEFFQSSFMRFVARMMNTVAIDQDTQLLKAMKASATGLKHGKVLNIFPEGERAFDGKLHEFKKGAAILATELDVPIVPVALDGLYKVWGRSSGKINFSKVKVRFGTPFYARDIVSAGMTDEAKYKAVTDYLKQTIQKMIDEMRN
jgi:long-chain acyl-CoA synthetase